MQKIYTRLFPISLLLTNHERSTSTTYHKTTVDNLTALAGSVCIQGFGFTAYASIHELSTRVLLYMYSGARSFSIGLSPFML